MATLSDPLGWFTLRFPDDWQRVTEDCVTILKSSCGTVYVSGGRRLGARKAGFGAAAFLTDFLQFIGIAVPEAAVQSWSGGEGHRVYHYLRESHGRTGATSRSPTARRRCSSPTRATPRMPAARPTRSTAWSPPCAWRRRCPSTESRLEVTP